VEDANSAHLAVAFPDLTRKGTLVQIRSTCTHQGAGATSMREGIEGAGATSMREGIKGAGATSMREGIEGAGATSMREGIKGAGATSMREGIEDAGATSMMEGIGAVRRTEDATVHDSGLSVTA
jgi:hypothetical protein